MGQENYSGIWRILGDEVREVREKGILQGLWPWRGSAIFPGDIESQSMFELRSDSVCYVESVLLQKKRRNQETSEEATTVAQAKNDGYLDKMGRGWK